MELCDWIQWDVAAGSNPRAGGGDGLVCKYRWPCKHEQVSLPVSQSEVSAQTEGGVKDDKNFILFLMWHMDKVA